MKAEKADAELELPERDGATAILRLDLLRKYKLSWLAGDIISGIIIFAVTIPTAIAYSQLAGVHPLNGLYASLLAMALYPLLGTSRQVVIGAEGSVAIMVAASLSTLVTAPDPGYYLGLAMLQAMLVGVILVIGGVFRVGFIADFIPKPIIIGFLNGMALVIIMSQVGSITGIELTQSDFFPRVWEFYQKIANYHRLTLILGGASLIGLFLFLFMFPKVPGPIVVTVLATAAVVWGNLGSQGIQLVGSVPPGLPRPWVLEIGYGDVLNMLPFSAAVALVAFFDVMATARAFAVKNRYEIDPNQDMIALGVANVGSGLFQGFSLGCSQSRTVINDVYGGKSQFASIVAAVLLALFLLYYTYILENVPIFALTAIVIMAAIKMLDPVTVFRAWRARPPSAYLSLVTTLAVLITGLMTGILVAVALAIIMALHRLTRPHEMVTRPPVARGLLIYRYGAPLFFFNATHFATRVHDLILGARPQVTFFLINAEAIVDMDMTAADMLEDIYQDLHNRGIILGICNAKGHFRKVLMKSGLIDRTDCILYPSIASVLEELTKKQLEEDGREKVVEEKAAIAAGMEEAAIAAVATAVVKELAKKQMEEEVEREDHDEEEDDDDEREEEEEKKRKKEDDD